MKNKDFAKNLIFDLDQLVPGQSVDCVIMGFDQNKLKIFYTDLQKFSNFLD